MLQAVDRGSEIGAGTSFALRVQVPNRRAVKQWVRRVTTDSTHPPRKTFTGSAAQIARTMARKDVSPKGIGSGIRMIQYFINRGGRNLSSTRRRELERAKRILQRRAASRRTRTRGR
jgi:tRNA(adenine34) deaminase